MIKVFTHVCMCFIKESKPRKTSADRCRDVARWTTALIELARWPCQVCIKYRTKRADDDGFERLKKKKNHRKKTNKTFAAHFL